jgi:hypothetical protein
VLLLLLLCFALLSATEPNSRHDGYRQGAKSSPDNAAAFDATQGASDQVVKLFAVHALDLSRV